MGKHTKKTRASAGVKLPVQSAPSATEIPLRGPKQWQGLGGLSTCPHVHRNSITKNVFLVHKAIIHWLLIFLKSGYMLNPLDPNCSLLLSSRCLEKTTRTSQGSQGSLDLQAINKSKGLSQMCCQVIGTMPFLPTSYKSVLTPKGSLEHFFLCLSCTCHITKTGEQEPPALTPFLSFTARHLTEIQGLVLFL